MTTSSGWLAGADAPGRWARGSVPAVVGAAAADAFIAWRFVAALLVALGLQVGVGHANDFFDGIRGVDTPAVSVRPRLVATGAASPWAVLLAALGSIGVAGFPGLRARVATEPVLILFVGALALVAASRAAAAHRPYAGLGLGELMVFLFFGDGDGRDVVRVDERVPAAAWWCGAVLRAPRGGRSPRREQPAGHPDGRRDREADAGRPSRADRRTRLLYRARRGRVRHD